MQDLTLNPALGLGLGLTGARRLKMLDLRRNPWSGGAEATDAEMAELRARVIAARPDLHELNGVRLRVARAACGMWHVASPRITYQRPETMDPPPPPPPL